MSKDMKINKELIKNKRHNRNWSQEELSIVAGLSLRTIQRVEKDGVTSVSSLKALASAFEINADELKLNEVKETPKWAKKLPKIYRLQENIRSYQESIKNSQAPNQHTVKIVKYFYLYILGLFALGILYKYLFL